MKRSSFLVILVIAVAAVAAAFALRSRSEDAPANGHVTDPAATATTTTISPASTTTTAPPATSTTLAAGASACDPYRSTSTSGVVASAALFETSGIAASRIADGVIWAHNDSGDDATLYAIGPQGEDLGSFNLGPGFAFDWEDLAIGPGLGNDQPFFYVGDIGDNFGIREGKVTVYRVREPDPNAMPQTVPIDRVFDLKAPDGPHNFEALFVADGSIFLATKDAKATKVFRSAVLTEDPEDPSLELIATLDLGAEVTAADLSWDGSTIAFRGYETVWMWHRGDDMSVAEALATTPCSAPSPVEKQGEALAFLADGAVVTISEGEHPEIHLVSRDS